jgi:hypothetical protein
MLPLALARGFSGYVWPNGLRERLKGLPGPKDVQCCVFVAVDDQPTGGTDLGPRRETLRHALPTA